MKIDENTTYNLTNYCDTNVKQRGALELHDICTTTILAVQYTTIPYGHCTENWIGRNKIHFVCDFYLL